MSVPDFECMARQFARAEEEQREAKDALNAWAETLPDGLRRAVHYATEYGRISRERLARTIIEQQPPKKKRGRR